MGKVLKFGNIEIEKQNYYQHKEPISIKYIYIYICINKTTVFNKVSFGKKRFNNLICYKNTKRHSCIFLPKMTAYRNDSDETKYISFLIKDDESLEKFSEI